MSDTVKTILYLQPEDSLDAAREALNQHPELLRSFLGKLAADHWRTERILLDDYADELHDVIKTSLKKKESLLLGYGGNVKYRYEKAVQVLKGEIPWYIDRGKIGPPCDDNRDYECRSCRKSEYTRGRPSDICPSCNFGEVSD